MKKALKLLSVYFTVVFLLGLALCCRQQDGKQVPSQEPPADSITRVEATIRFLADDLLEGRGTPGRGLDISALYLANELRAAGWKPADGQSYLQTFTIKDFHPAGAVYHVSINGKKLDAKDYILMPYGIDPLTTPKTYDLVFTGYGIFAPERGVNDFEGVDIQGKAVISLLGSPWENDPHAVFGYDKLIGKGISVTAHNGGMLIYVSEELEAAPDSPPSLEIGFMKIMSGLPCVYIPEFEGRSTSAIGAGLMITPSVFDRTLAADTGGTYAEWKDRLSKGNREAKALKSTLELRIDVRPRESRTSNVLAVLPGSDPELKEEWVVLTAHYDHLGYFEAPAGVDGIYNGADDNASGTAAVLEIARRLAEERPLRRSVLVALVTGEERGLLGSAYYAAHPAVPKDSVVVDINADMVGRSTGTLGALTAGCDDLLAKATEFGKAHGIEVTPDQHLSWRLAYLTDSYHFARFGVPAITFFTDLHQDYHQPSDEIQLIRFDDLEKILEVLYELTRFYAQGGEKPRVERPEWFITPN